MDANIANGKIGSDGTYTVTFTAGKLRAEVGYQAMVNAGMFIEVDSDTILDAIAKAIPGTVDDSIIAIIKTALKA